MKTLGSKKLLKLILQFAIGIVVFGLLWIVFSFTRPNIMMMLCFLMKSSINQIRILKN